MRNAILLSVLLLSACATEPRVGGATDAEQAPRQSVTVPQPAAPQKSTPVEAQQPVPSVQGDTPSKKNKHNVEQD